MDGIASACVETCIIDFIIVPFALNFIWKYRTDLNILMICLCGIVVSFDN